MKKKINIDSMTFWFLYRKYKQFLLPMGVILACIVLFIFVIIPQFQNLLDNQKQAKIESEKLLVLKNNLNLLTNLNESQVDSQLKVVSRALPPEKDFGGILNAISYSANKAGVSLGDFQFQVGEITKPPLNVSSFPSLEIKLAINGGTEGVLRFLNELYKSVPLSEAISIKASNTVSEITAIFYYKPFPPLTISESSPMSPISSQSLSIIGNISSWGYASDNTPIFQTPASSSPSATPTGSQ